MNRNLPIFTLVALTICALSLTAHARDFSVSVVGNDHNDGSPQKPFRTISAAAAVAQPGDVVTVHAGTYRERVTPRRGGESDQKRIIYEAAPGERVEIKGSEIIRGWQPCAPDAPEAWKVVLPTAFFGGGTNPYAEPMRGDWLGNRRQCHAGEVYLNGKSLWEVADQADILHPKAVPRTRDPDGLAYNWRCESDAQNTTIYANFHGHDPNRELVEINVRDACFYPAATGCDYITVRGFHLSQAATPWAAPTSEQLGLIGTFWSKGWIIEDNEVSDSKCAGITLGLDGKSGHPYGQGGGATAGYYNEVIEHALVNGWSKEKIGSHVVRNNVIHDCGQAGICGSLGAVFSRITGNDIYDIYTQRLFNGAEMGGIKIHASIDVLIQGNRIHHAYRGMWMDWMAQGTRITANLCHDNDAQDLYCEVDHGPYLVDNNLFLSANSLWDMSEGGAYAHNLFCGTLTWRADTIRATPHLLAHSTRLAGLAKIDDTDNHFYNNIFVGPADPSTLPPGQKSAPNEYKGYGLAVYDAAKTPLRTGGNRYWRGAKSYQGEKGAAVEPGFNPDWHLETDGMAARLRLTPARVPEKSESEIVNTMLLGKTLLGGLPYEQPDGSPLSLDRDYFSTPRNSSHPVAGPFEDLPAGKQMFEVWPVKH